MKFKYRFKYRKLIPHYHNWKEIEDTLRAIENYCDTPNCDIEVKCTFCGRKKRVLKDISNLDTYSKLPKLKNKGE